MLLLAQMTLLPVCLTLYPRLEPVQVRRRGALRAHPVRDSPSRSHWPGSPRHGRPHVHRAKAEHLFHLDVAASRAVAFSGAARRSDAAV